MRSTVPQRLQKTHSSRRHRPSGAIMVNRRHQKRLICAPRRDSAASTPSCPYPFGVVLVSRASGMYSRSGAIGRHGGAVLRALGQWVAVLPGPAKGTQPCCRRLVRSVAIAPAVDMVHRVWPMIRERSIGGYPGYPVALAVSGWVKNPVSVMPESSIRSTSAPDSGAFGD